jgi:hypothetical protein
VPAAAHARVGSELRHGATDQERRLLAALLEYIGDQRAGARLAMRAGHADAFPRGYDLGQDIRAVANAQAAATRRDELRLVVRHGARDDHLHVPVEVSGIVTHARIDALG